MCRRSLRDGRGCVLKSALAKKCTASWLAVVVWAGFIFAMSAHSGDSLHGGSGIISTIFQALAAAQERLLGDGVDLMSPVAHFLEYAVLGALLANALRHHIPWWSACLLAVVFASLCGVTDELHQWFVPNRMADPVDWLVDTCGAAFGATALCVARRVEWGKMSAGRKANVA